MEYLPTSVLKGVDVFLHAPLVAHLANLLFTEGCFPDRYKRAQVTPLMKHPGLDADNPTNYRPIFNLTTISKIIERLVLAIFRGHITGSQSFNVSQSAYRRHHSTETALLCILKDIYGKIDQGHSTLLVGLDLSAAFDTVEHSVLVTRLKRSFGVRGVLLTRIESYLIDRTQFIRLGSSSSAVTQCPCGVPQGSVLGPLLLVAYISSTSNTAAQFGVGTQMYVALSPTHINTSISNLQNCFTAVHLWFSQNGLVINPVESEAIIFSTAQRARKTLTAIKQVDVASCQVQVLNSVNVLGITLDQHLTFKDHVQNVCKSAQYYTRALRQIRFSLTADMAKTVASALVNPRFDYANDVLYDASEHDLAKLQLAQNALVRYLH